jgi:hypothetical protein
MEKRKKTQLLKAVCWIDFRNEGPTQFITRLSNEGFCCTKVTEYLDVWKNQEMPGTIIELLNLDQRIEEPVSTIATESLDLIHRDRLRLCVPRHLDPFFRCLIYSVENSESTSHGFQTTVKRLQKVIKATSPSFVWSPSDTASQKNAAEINGFNEKD